MSTTAGDEKKKPPSLDELLGLEAETEAVDDRASDVAEREAQLRAIERELELRLALGGGLSLHIKRLTKI